MKTLLYALPGGMASRYSDFGLTPAHMCYRIAPGPRLTGVALDGGVRGGAMLISCAGMPDDGNVQPCCRQILSECRYRGFTRVICDFECAPQGVCARLAAALAPLCASSGLPLCLPEPFAPLAPDCQVLVSSRILSGTLRHTLSCAAQHYGPERVVLAIDAGAEELPLPAAGSGKALEASDLQQLIRRLEPAIFFDRGLCAHYFTYMSRPGGAHFVLFNSPRSVRAKLDAAQALSIPEALLAAPQTEEWLGELFGGNA